ncbi:MAG: AI-2E family transporter [Lachnospiraceae bacterium]|nr:AI-2E family transporter [Lachnospiraceae bacterium]
MSADKIEGIQKEEKKSVETTAIPEQPTASVKKKDKWFQPNHTYTTICIYVLLVILFGTILAMLVVNWSDTQAFFFRLIQIISPFLAGLLIAYFLLPLVGRCERLLNRCIAHNKYPRIVRYISILVAYVLVIGFIIVAVVFVVPEVGESIQELTESIPVMYDHIANFLMALQDKYPDLDMEDLTEQLKAMVPDLVNHGTNLVKNLVPVIYSFSMSVVRGLINVLLAIMLSIYMIASREFFLRHAKRLIYALLTEKHGDAFCKTCRECNDIFSAFLLSKAVDSFIIGCLCCIIMSIIGLPYAVLLSVIVGITNMIPYFGPFIGAVPGVLIYLCTDPAKALVFAIMILILQQFDGLVLGPRLLGQSTGLNPVWVIFAITVGGAYFGIVGMFIGVPVVAVFAFLLNKLIVHRLRGKKISALEEVQD